MHSSIGGGCHQTQRGRSTQHINRYWGCYQDQISLMLGRRDDPEDHPYHQDHAYQNA